MSRSHTIVFESEGVQVDVPTGTTLTEAAQLAGVSMQHPCGGQGRCGRCAVKVVSGDFRQRSSLRLSSKDIEEGYALACQSIIEGDLRVVVPPQEKVERRLVTDLTARKVTIPEGYNHHTDQTIKRINLKIDQISFVMHARNPFQNTGCDQHILLRRFVPRENSWVTFLKWVGSMAQLMSLIFE